MEGPQKEAKIDHSIRMTRSSGGRKTLHVKSVWVLFLDLVFKKTHIALKTQIHIELPGPWEMCSPRTTRPPSPLFLCHVVCPVICPLLCLALFVVSPARPSLLSPVLSSVCLWLLLCPYHYPALSSFISSVLSFNLSPFRASAIPSAMSSVLFCPVICAVLGHVLYSIFCPLLCPVLCPVQYYGLSCNVLFLSSVITFVWSSVLSSVLSFTMFYDMSSVLPFVLSCVLSWVSFLSSFCLSCPLSWLLP